MELVDRYLYAVCKHLPAKNRNDIEQELRSSIMDALEAKSLANPAEEDVIAVLKDFGPPKKVAQNYTTYGSYLVGPQLFDLYMLILKIVLSVGLFGVVISFIIGAIQTPGEMTDFITQIIITVFERVFSMVIGVVGTVTIVFAIIQRVNPGINNEMMNNDKEWHPKDLAPIPHPFEKIKPTEVIAGMLFTLLFFVLVNFYTHLLGFYFQIETGKPSIFISLLNLQAIAPYMLFINILLGIAFIKQILLLRDSRYKVYTFILELLGNLGVLAIISLILAEPTPLNLSELDLVITNTDSLNSLKEVLASLYRGILIVCGIISLIEFLKYAFRFYQHLGKRRG